MNEPFSDDEVYRELLEAVVDAGSQTQLASRLGISDSYVSACVTRKKQIRGKLLRHIGFELRPVYIALRSKEVPDAS